ncbi:hypothetical protein AKJ37_05660 [candidate division MSBL1 archaeon SCGC-AAA259I09]|uniref:Uncharacterized protein n=1 Tax=candidate division MSBL1 archaeon SCGC-AAA259I09 TaxID=1698267 RepID=A0A133UQ40_9EURY|nr:hypothetical protein AKJ37_05660 [candidate division MSBL1 archaeon SCGC-AAA259I09]
MQASFDNAKSWKEVSLSPIENESSWRAGIDFPNNSYVSIRCTVSDNYGNKTTQTTIAGFYGKEARQIGPWNLRLTASGDGSPSSIYFFFFFYC